jgi:hypothetical protein
MRIAKYKTAVGSDIPELDKEVNKLIDQGFDLYGNPFFGTWNIPGKLDTYGFFQAMIMTTDSAAKLLKAEAEVRARQRQSPARR